MMRNLLLAGLIAMALPAPALSATILTYVSAAGPSIAPTSVASGVSATNLLRGPGLLEATGSTFNSRNWTLGGTAATARTNGDYLGFSLTSTIAYDLTSLVMRHDRSGTGPLSIAVDLIVNSIACNGFFNDASVSPTGETATIDLSGFLGVTSFSFRLLGFGATNLAGTFDFENPVGGAAVTLAGNVTPPAPVPLPPAFALLALGLLMLARRKAV